MRLKLDNPDDIIMKGRRVGIWLSGLSAVAAGAFGWIQGPDLFFKALFCAGFGLFSLIASFALVLAINAYKDGMKVAAGVAAAIFAVAFVVEGVGHVGVIAAHRATGTSQASVKLAANQMATSNVTELRADVTRLQSRVNAPQRAKGEAQGDIDNAKAHRMWAETGGCVTTNGPKTREFCAKYFSAIKDVAAADARSTDESELKSAKGKLAQAQGSGALNDTGLDAAGAQSAILSSLLTISENPDKTQAHWAGVSIALIMALVFLMPGPFNALVWSFPTTAERAARAALQTGKTAVQTMTGAFPQAPAPVASSTSPLAREALFGSDTHLMKIVGGAMSRRAA